ncbi:unnamed protein product [Symbiodinium sp. CCMP2592]|nr:unnamed protein product [Symbiodinium sp. CCMP2592]
MSLVAAEEAWRRWGDDVQLSAGVAFTGRKREPQSVGWRATEKGRQLSIVPAVGGVVQFKACERKPELSLCYGTIARRENGMLTISLAPASVRDLLQLQLRGEREEIPASLEAAGASAEAAQAAGSGAYAPLQGQVRMLEQAKKTKEALVLWHGRSAMLPVWAKSFWQEVGLMEPLEQRLKVLLLSQGYLGRGVGSPPRFRELKEKLDELSTAGAVAHSLDAFRAQDGAAWIEEGDEGPEGWEAALLPDLKRAGPEIYSSMKAAGVRCVRDWVNSMFSVEQRQSAHYVDLFNLASLVDFKAKEGGPSQAKVLSIIAQDDTCEVALRRLAAWIHERRTGDRDAAQSMLAIKPSSFSTDVAPSWLVTEAASYSQSEHKRRERARAQSGAGAAQGSGCAHDALPDHCMSDCIQDLCSSDGRVFPLPLPPMPPQPQSSSPRLRKRWRERLILWKLVFRWISFLNDLYSSTLREPKKHFAATRAQSPISAAQAAVLRRLWDRAKDCREGRRREPLVSGTGGHSAAVQIVKGAVADDSYARVKKKQNQIPLQAKLIAEPSENRVVDMLEALPRSESDFYSSESNCIDMAGKARQLQDDIEQQFAFVGGTFDEYCKYFHRSDLPSNMWSWRSFSEVKAIAGFSCVPKKDGVTQRKLVMCCSFNYLLSDVEARSRLGMTGAGALARTHLEKPGLKAAVCDQSNAFTSVLVPEWMIPYQAVPPLPAGEVWELLPRRLREGLSATDWVCPCYMRLPMGCSHSVHILMSINLRIIGMTLFSSQLLSRTPASGHFVAENYDIEQRPPDMHFGCSDAEWWERFAARGSYRAEAGFSVEQWWAVIRKARLAPHRVFVIMHLFGGERRLNDVQHFAERFAEEAGLTVLFATVDLATDHRWDLAREDTQHELLGMMSGFVDLLMLGPPCSTVSRARHADNSVGVRPVRFRDCFWGRPDLLHHERARVEEANVLYKHSMALCDRISLYGGSFLWEHPKDPGCQPYPSIFATTEFREMLARTGSASVSFDQCTLGGPTRKPTTLAGNARGLDRFVHCACPGESSSHRHERSMGFDSEGHFLTRRLQTYPPGMCRLVAECMIESCTAWQASGEGPTGFFAKGPRAPLAPWSVSASADRIGVRILNEAVEDHVRVLLGDDHLGLYLHVDDTLYFSEWAHEIADNMEAAGFRVPDRRSGDEIAKVVGYEIDAQKGEFSLPHKKARLLQAAFLEVASARFVCVELLRALVGIWSFGAQLRRDLYSIPFSVYHMLDICEGQFVRLWPSVRRELIAMARFMVLRASDPVSRLVFATDAMGADDVDCGGYGICVAQATYEEFAALMWAGEEPGFAISERDRGLKGFRNPADMIKLTRPFSRLPRSLFEDFRWTELQAGRWRSADHITIGEARAVTKCLELRNDQRKVLVMGAKLLPEAKGCAWACMWIALHFLVVPAHAGRSGLKTLDPLHVNSVLSDTYKRYERAVEKFEVFLLQNDAAPTSAAELDEWLILFRREASLTRSQFEVTLAGIQFLAPRLKGKLPLAKKVTKGLAIEYPAKHAFPMLSRSARFIASKMATAREHRLGVCMLLQQATGLRPSEMLGLCEHDIIRPSDFVPRYVLRLGTNVGTKVGREQTAFFDPEQDPVLAMLLFRLLRATPERGSLAACGYDHYRKVLARHSSCLGVQYSPHSCRAGFATEAIIKGEAPTLVQRRGRWKSEASFLVYIDVATALQRQPMGLPVTVAIEDASEEESSEYQPPAPSRPVRSQPRQRAMTPPPRALQSRPGGRRSKLDGSTVLTAERRAHLPADGLVGSAADGAVRDPPRRGALRRKQASWFGWIWKSCCKGAARLRMMVLWGSLAYVIAAGPMRELLLPVQSLLVSTAQVGESAAGALSSILDGGTQLVSASTSVVKAASVNTLSVAQAAWIGVDLVGMNATKVVGRVLGETSEAIELWLFSTQGREVLRDPAQEALTFWLGLLRSQTFHLPVTTGVVSFAANGLVVFEFRMLRMTFSPRWANPVWQVGGWNAEDEYDQILLLARDFATTVPAVNHTWDQILAPPPSSAHWPAIVGLLRRLGALLGSPLRASWRFWASMWEYGTMHPLAFGGLVLVTTGGCLCVRRLGPLAAPPAEGHIVHWRRLVELMLLMRGWMLVRGGSLARQLLH